MTILKNTRVLAVIAISLVAGIVWQVYFSGAGGAPGRGRFGKVKRGDLVQRVTVSGLIEPARKTLFVAPYEGYIHKIYVKIGDRVAKGAPVISIASSLSGVEPVYPMRSPFAGLVVDVDKQEGEYVSKEEQKKTIARVDDVGKFFVLAKSAELDASRIKRDMEVEIRINAFKHNPLKGIVREIDLAAEEAEGWRQQQATFGVKVEILNPPPQLRSGQSAIVDIVTDKYADVLYLEHEFINQEAGKYFVITRRGQRRNIEVGRQSDLAVEILNGLQEGEEVEQVDFLKLLEGES